ncbi:MAG: NAD(+)/NADH kinase [bacterium]|nr:NAD(+)/NADH kinase [bacterium]
MPDRFKSIALTAWPYARKQPLDFRALLAWLREKKFNLLLDETVAEAAGESGGLPRGTVHKEADLVIVLGGDGSMLHAAHQMKGESPPLLGVNTGHLGFLSDLPQATLYLSLENILLKGKFEIETRMRLRPAVRKNGVNKPLWDVLNDVVITSGPLARMVEFRVKVENRLLGDFRADGLILATPTGSTAYSLSAGGPLIMPGLKVMVVNPICPHTLSNRPIVVPADQDVEVQIFADKEIKGRRVLLTLDGQHGCELEPADSVYITESPDPIRLVRPLDIEYFQILRDKLNWETRLGGEPNP